MYTILAKRTLNSAVEEMEVHAPFVARKCEPGQFIIIRVTEDGERIPLTIKDYNREKESITIVYQVVGQGTKLLADKNPGESINDVAGPLGIPTELKQHKRVLGIAGGVGAAPLYPQLRKLAEMGVAVDVIIGGRSSEFVLLADDFAKFCKNVYITTDDGSGGVKGFVTDKLKSLIAAGEVYEEVISIGPVIMMKFVSAITREHNIPTSVSLNPIMVDGTGMCGGCRVSIGGQTKFACVDGPDFDGHLVDFDELMRRQTMYKDKEAHSCKIGLEG